MLWDNSETNRLNELVARGFQAATKDELQYTVDAGKARKPAGLDQISAEAQQHYRGDQEQSTRAQLQSQFPASKLDTFPIAPINWLRFFARQDAGVYVQTPDRYLVEAGDPTKPAKRVDADDPRSLLWAWALEASAFHTQMAEVERRALIPPGSVVVLHSWLKPAGPGDVGLPHLELLWPHDAFVICHWQAPTMLRYATIVGLRRRGPNTKGDWWRIWSRKAPATLEEQGSWGKWQSVLLSTAGEQAGPIIEEKMGGGHVLPISVVQLTSPAGSPWVLEDPDLLKTVCALNAARSNEMYVIGMQGHDVPWTDTTKEVGELVYAPDNLMQVLPGHRVELLHHNPLLGDMREGRKLQLREVAISRSNNPDAYATEPGPPLSGAAKEAANIPHDTRVREQSQLMKLAEDRDVAVKLHEGVATFHPSGGILRGTAPVMKPRRPKKFVEPAQQTLQNQQRENAGWISKPRAAFEDELYDSVAEAEQAIKEIEAAKPKAPTPGFGQNARTPPGANDGADQREADGSDPGRPQGD